MSSHPCQSSRTLRSGFAAKPSFKQAGSCLVSGVIAIVVITLLVALTLYLLKLNSIIVNKFEGKRWDIPAKVYAQPLEIYQGANLSHTDLQHSLQLLNYKKTKNYKTTGSYHKQGSTYFVHTRGFNYGDSTDAEQVLKITLSGGVVSKIQSTKPTDTGMVRLEPVLIGGIYPDSNEDRVLIQLKHVPKPLVEALIATEDRAFYKHNGVSLRGTARALYTNLTSNKTQGGSTITQQLIKNFYLNSERKLKRKINEALMAILLEMHYSKDDILQAYMNEINLGQNGNRSINGFGLAAQFYFNQPLSELSTDKLALLVGIAKGPSYYNPWRNSNHAKARRNIVLKNMLTVGKLTAEQYETLSKKPLGVVETPVAGKNRFPDFLNIVQRQLKQQYQEDDLQTDGLRVFTTLDPLAQKKATDSFDGQIKRLRKQKKLDKLQGALVSANPQNGELLAVVGGYGAFTGFNRVRSKRQVGSVIKPFVYLNALASGRYTLASPVEDNPISLRSGKQTWSPQNYDNRSHGYVPLSEALAKSYNQATVRLGNELGIDKFIDTLHRLGIKEELPSYPSVLLGAVELSPMQVLSAYQTIASNGFGSPLNSIRTVLDAKGKPLQRYSLKVEQRIDPAASYLLNAALQHVVQYGTAKRIKGLGNNLAGKTGTTNNYKDAWFAGYSGNYVTVVWVGNDDATPTKLSGSSGALPVWQSFMSQLQLEPVSLVQPKNVQWVWLENGTGLVTDERCELAVYVPVLANHMPKQVSECAQALYAPRPTSPEAPVSIEPTPSESQSTPSNADIEQNVIEKAFDELTEWF